MPKNVGKNSENLGKIPEQNP